MPQARKARAVGFNHVALEVGDIEEALAFYGRLFEFELRGRSGTSAFIDLGDQFLALQTGRTQPADDGRHFGLVVDDKDAVRKALAAAGVEPSGYRAPYWQLTQETLDLLPGAGISYDSSLMDDDRPYVVEAGGASLAELPVHWSLDDWEQYGFLPEPDIGQQIELPAKAVELWTGELDAMRATGSLCVLTCHPFLSGRPSRIRALDRFIEFARERGDVEILGAEELARRVVAG